MWYINYGLPQNFEYMNSKILKKEAPIDDILDDVKEMIVTESPYKAIPYDVLRPTFYHKGMF